MILETVIVLVSYEPQILFSRRGLSASEGQTGAEALRKALFQAVSHFCPLRPCPVCAFHSDRPSARDHSAAGNRAVTSYTRRTSACVFCLTTLDCPGLGIFEVLNRHRPSLERRTLNLELPSQFARPRYPQISRSPLSLFLFLYY